LKPSGVLRTAAYFFLFMALALMMIAPRGARAQDPGYLGSLPTAEQVFSRFADGSDPVQTLGRQCAALSILERRFFRSHAIMTRQVEAHANTKRVRQDYGQGFMRLREAYQAAVGGMDDAKQRTWNAMCENRNTRGLDQPISMDDVLALIPAEVQAVYAAAYARSDALMAAMKTQEEAAAQAAIARDARDQLARAKMAAENRQFRWIALLILAAGAGLFAFAGRTMFRLGKYAFENTTDGGVTRFSSYRSAIGHSLMGKFSALVLLVGGLTVVAGMVMFLSTFG
jgi:hypothetical protein